MASGIGRPWFIGCACDQKFVEPTSVMLTSLDLNGDVSGATILVASFGLNAADRDILRAGAGRLAGRMRFVDIDEEMLDQFAGVEFRSEYPLPVLGRLFLPAAIDVPGARLLTLDSDMIVNRPVRPLLELDMNDQFLGAIHDVPRDDPNYFNTGMLLIDIEGFKRYDIAARSLRWLAEQTSHPTFPDQDALNTVVGDSWYRLDRSWNWFYTGPDKGDLPLRNDHYKAANIAHFAGGKPWNIYAHAGRPLYMEYLERLQDRKRVHGIIDTNFVITAYEVLLGRAPESEIKIRDWLNLSPREVVTRLVRSAGFAMDVVLPIKLNLPFTNEHLQAPLSFRERLWAADRLPVSVRAQERMAQANSRRELLAHMLEDEQFAAWVGLTPMLALADGILGHLPAMLGRLHASDVMDDAANDQGDGDEGAGVATGHLRIDSPERAAE